MKTISNNTELEEIIAGGKPVILDFYAEWCGPCKALLPVLEAASTEYAEKITVAKINVEENSEIAKKFGVRSIPAVFLLKKGAVVDQFTGIQTRNEINKRIDHLISTDIEKTGKLNILPS